MTTSHDIQPHRRPRGLGFLRFMGLAAMLSVAPQMGFAQSGSPSPTPVKASQLPVPSKADLEVLVVHGDESGKIDARLKPIMRHLRYMPHTGYRLLRRDDRFLGVGADHAFELVDGLKLKVSLVSLTGTQAKIRVEMFHGEARKMDSVLAVHRNKAFLIAGPKHEDGELILAITPKY